MSGHPASARWYIGLAMAGIAAVAAVISYNDGLTVARLAGNHGWAAFLYPLLPDGLIVVCLAALYEAARRKLNRPSWATAGLVLGIALTVAQNTGAGIAHSALDALMYALVPVVFFVAVEVLVWHVRAGRQATADAEPEPLVPAFAGAPVPGLRQLQRDLHMGAPKARQVQQLIRASMNGHATPDQPGDGNE